MGVSEIFQIEKWAEGKVSVDRKGHNVVDGETVRKGTWLQTSEESSLSRITKITH